MLVYSQWSGYLEKDFWDEHNVDIVEIHTSGHAFVEELQAFVGALNPTKVIPIHTLHPEKFGEYFGNRTQVLCNGESIGI